MSKVGFRIKGTSNKSATIYVYMRPMNHKTVETRTGLSVLPSEWSQTKQRAKGRDVSCINLNSALSDLASYIDKNYNQVQISGGSISLEWFKKCVDSFFNRNDEKDIQFLDNFYSVFLDRMESDSLKKVGYKENTIKSYKSFKLLMDDFQKVIGYRIKFSDLDKDSFEDLFSWLLHERGYNANYVNRSITRLKTICKEAASFGVSVNPYFSLYKPKKVNIERHLNILTPDDIEKLKKYNPKKEYLKNTKKWTLIGLHIGQRVSDLLKLKPGDIKGSRKWGFIY